jgi:arginine utilization regulatory protein
LLDNYLHQRFRKRKQASFGLLYGLQIKEDIRQCFSNKDRGGVFMDSVDARLFITDREMILLLKSILDSINEGVIACDSEGKIIFYNRCLEKLEGRSMAEILGKHLTEVYEVTPENSEQLTVLKTGKPILDENLNYIANGKEMHVVSSTFPLKDKNATIAVYSVSRDITGIRSLLLRSIDIQGKSRNDFGKETLKNGTKYCFSDIVGTSNSISKVLSEAHKAAASSSPVLVYGETGTGKELFVQGIHNAGINCKEPFVAVNCAAIPESLLESLLFGTVRGAFTGAEHSPGLFEQAGRGTLYLDEVNSMKTSLQAKTLRVLQEMKIRRVGAQNETPIHCRVISSTNVDPWQCVEENKIRKDLFYRLAVIQIYLPPLRDHIEDLQSLVDHFLTKYGRIFGKQVTIVSDQLLKVLKEHTWPGNIRELEHLIENSLAMMEEEDCVLTIDKIPQPLISRSNKRFSKNLIGNKSTLAEILANVEKRTILNSLNMHDWNVSRAAKYIGIGRQNLQYRMNKLGIRRPDITYVSDQYDL